MASPTPKIKQRVKVSILPSDTAQEEIELDYRVLITGDFSKSGPGNHKDGATLKERRVRVIKNKKGFQDALSELNPRLRLFVPNKFSENPEDQLEVNLGFESMKDFHPDQIAQKVEPLRKLMEARERLKQFKMEVVSNPQLKKAVEKVLTSAGQDKVIDDLLSRLAPPSSEKTEEKKEG